MKYLLIALTALLLAACQSSPSPKEETPESKPSTASPNVRILNDSLSMPGLDRKRLLRVYLPPGYDTSTASYPVLYMHDGQNLFDDSTAYVGEWGVDEIMNQLAIQKDLKLIIVGIDNGLEKRMNEMSPWDHERFGKGEGAAYVSFIVKEVKPLIDSRYRTQPARTTTGILGSSMGGLISHYAAYAYPETFGKVGIFSPSYWYAEEVSELTASKPVSADTRLFLIVGEKESESMAPNAKRMYEQILASGHPKENLHLAVDPEGTHSEGFWQDNFAEAVSWLYQEE